MELLPLEPHTIFVLSLLLTLTSLFYAHAAFEQAVPEGLAVLAFGTQAPVLPFAIRTTPARDVRFRMRKDAFQERDSESPTVWPDGLRRAADVK